MHPNDQQQNKITYSRCAYENKLGSWLIILVLLLVGLVSVLVFVFHVVFVKKCSDFESDDHEDIVEEPDSDKCITDVDV